MKLDTNKGYVDLLGEDSARPPWAQNARYAQDVKGVRHYFDSAKRYLKPPDDEAEVREQERLEDLPSVGESAVDDDEDSIFDSKPSEDGLTLTQVQQERKDAEHLGPSGVQMSKNAIIEKAYAAETAHELHMLATDANIKVDKRLKNVDSIRDAIVAAAQDLP